MNDLKKKLAAGQVVLGTHICLDSSVLTEIIGKTGYDYLWIDLEHTSFGLDVLEQHLIAARAAGTPALVRVPWNDPVRLKPVLEMAPAGVIIPMVCSYEEAVSAVQACLYPPNGIRGYGPKYASQYGKVPLHEYLSNAAEATMRILQIEHIDAVRDLKRIASVPGADAFIIGPCDLALSVGRLEEMEGPEMDALFREIIDTVHEAGKPVGVSYGLCSEKEIARWIDRGVDMISLGCETDFIITESERLLNSMQKLAKNAKNV